MVRPEPVRRRARRLVGARTVLQPLGPKAATVVRPVGGVARAPEHEHEPDRGEDHRREDDRDPRVGGAVLRNRLRPSLTSMQPLPTASFLSVRAYPHMPLLPP